MSFPYCRTTAGLGLLLLLQAVNALQSHHVVTGANGYVGKAIVHSLLEEEQPPSADEETVVYCLVRPHRVETEQAYWQRQQPSNRCEIQVLPYDMLDGGTSLSSVLERIPKNQGSTTTVYHTACVFGPTEDHVQTAHNTVKGCDDLVKTLGAHTEPLRLVLTSSMAAVRASGQEPRNGQYYTHKDWNTESELGANWGASYQWSKAESERVCWDICQEYDHVSMTSLCPSFVFGPPHNASSSYSVSLVQSWVEGKAPVQSRLLVDVRDVARAHVVAGRLVAAAGQRYLLSTEARVPGQTVAAWLEQAIGPHSPTKIAFDADYQGGAIPIGEQEVEAEERLNQELGVKLRSVEETMVDMAEALLLRSSKLKQ